MVNLDVPFSEVNIVKGFSSLSFHDIFSCLFEDYKKRLILK